MSGVGRTGSDDHGAIAAYPQGQEGSHAVRYWLGQEVTVKGVVTRVDDDGVDEAGIYVMVGGQGVWLSVCSATLVGRTGPPDRTPSAALDSARAALRKAWHDQYLTRSEYLEAMGLGDPLD